MEGEAIQCDIIEEEFKMERISPPAQKGDWQRYEEKRGKGRESKSPVRQWLYIVVGNEGRGGAKANRNRLQRVNLK